MQHIRVYIMNALCVYDARIHCTIYTRGYNMNNLVSLAWRIAMTTATTTHSIAVNCHGWLFAKGNTQTYTRTLYPAYEHWSVVVRGMVCRSTQYENIKVSVVESLFGNLMHRHYHQACVNKCAQRETNEWYKTWKEKKTHSDRLLDHAKMFCTWLADILHMREWPPHSTHTHTLSYWQSKALKESH